jgi:hypothetical protein
MIFKMECGKRLAYDGEFEFRHGLKSHGGTIGVTCDHCVKKLKNKILDLQKHDRRRH